MTIGAKELASFVVPNGCKKNRTTRMAQDTPTTVPLVISGFTTLIPWMAPSTDCAGVRTPSDMISATPKTPIVLRKNWARPLLSMKFLAVLALRRSSPVCTLSILIIDSSRGSLFTILACIFVRTLALQNWKMWNGELTCRERRVNKAKVPPSPSSSALRTMKMYLTLTIKVKVQMIRERAPRRSS